MLEFGIGFQFAPVQQIVATAEQSEEGWFYKLLDRGRLLF